MRASKRRTTPTHYPVNPCPYCGGRARLVDKSSIYGQGRRFSGSAWLCDCGAYVGCHPGTNKALGRLADPALRRAKQLAHEAFDPLWKAKAQRGDCGAGKARRLGYDWLAERLGIDPSDCHIGHMDKE